VVSAGYVREAGAEQHVGSTVTLILGGDAVIIVDPGMVASRAGLLAAVARHGIARPAQTASPVIENADSRRVQTTSASTVTITPITTAVPSPRWACS
jgi:hypothetical protein